MPTCHRCERPEKGNIRDSEEVEITCARCWQDTCATDEMQEATEIAEATIQQKLRSARQQQRQRGRK